MQSHRLSIVLTSLLSLAACVVDVPDVDKGAIFACETDQDCARNYRCNPANRLCTPKTAPDDCADPAVGCRSGEACVKTPDGTNMCVATCPPDLGIDKPCSGTLTKGELCVLVPTVPTGLVASVCAPCDCQVGTCHSRTEAHQYANAVVCIGSACTSDTSCTTAPLTRCDLSQSPAYCVNPCDTDVCGFGLLCEPDGVGTERYKCNNCGAGKACPSDRACVPANAMGDVCVPNCVPNCPDVGLGKSVCANVQTAAGGSANVCAYCGNSCGSNACVSTGTTGDWLAAASCQGSDPCADCTTQSLACVYDGGSSSSVTCEPPCPTVDTPCWGQAGTLGWCVNVNGPNGNVAQICAACSATCTNGLACKYTGVTGSYANTAAMYVDNKDTCQCVDTPDGWYSVAGSGCDGGISNATTALEVLTDEYTLAGVDGTLAVAWADQTGNIQARRYSVGSTTWGNFGSPVHRAGGDSSTQPHSPALASTTNGSAFRLTWQEMGTSGKPEIYWAYPAPTGPNWAWGAEGTVTGGDVSNSDNGLSISSLAYGASAPAAALGVSGYDYTAVWVEAAAGVSQVWARHYGGSTWDLYAAGNTTDPGFVSVGLSYATAPQVAFNHGSGPEPAVVFVDQDNNTIEMRVRAFASGTPAWTSVSGVVDTSLSPDTVGEPTIIFDGMKAIVAYTSTTGGTSGIVVREQNASFGSYSGIPMPISLPGSGSGPALALSANGLLVAYRNGLPAIQVRRLLSGTVYSLGDDALQSNDAGMRPKIATVSQAPNGSGHEAVCVAWTTVVFNARQLYLRCHDLP